MSKASREARILAGLNATAAAVWGLWLLERSSWGYNPVSDYGAALGPVALFVLIPAGCIAVFRSRRRTPEPISASHRRYARLSAMFLAATWVFTWIPMIFWSGLFMAVASQRWPINIREGPDTAFARQQFEEHFGFSPDGVSGLYGRRGWEFGDGNTYQLKFEFRDPAIIERIVRVAGLEPVPEHMVKASWVVEAEPPDWWAKGSSGYDEAYQRGSQPRLWVDRAGGTAYYRSWP